MRELKRSSSAKDSMNSLLDRTIVESPCVRQCCIDEATGRCVGCARTLAEITSWSGLDNAGKLRVLAALEQRKAEGGAS